MKLLSCFLSVILHMLISASLFSQTFYHTGNSEPVETDHLPGLVLAGGGGDNDEAMQWMLARANGGDVVVLRASGSDGYNSYFYSELGVTINSVTTIVITSAAQADNENVINALSNAEVVFIAGGDQWNYVTNWRNTLMLETLNDLLINKQITIGGTSAGMAVLGEVIFTAENASVWSSEALGNPYHWRVKLEKEFLQVPFMENTVTDTHYSSTQGDGNDRKGRHVAFMARMVTDWDMPAKGIGANEYTAVAVDEEGMAHVFGDPNFNDYAYFLKKHGGPPEQCTAGAPLSWNQNQKAIKVYKIKGDPEGSGWFNINNWTEGMGGTWQYWYAIDGELFREDAGFNVLFNVKNHLNQPVENATITLNGTENDPGNYLFEDISPGLYEYIVLKTCYLTSEGTINIEDTDLAADVVLMHFPGDANGDGTINVLDIISIANYFAYGDSVDICLMNADVNNDNSVDALDIIIIVNDYF